MFYIISFILGASFGSFVGLLSHRLNVYNSSFKKSKCLSCGESIKYIDLIPIISYLLLSGRCRSCKSKIGINYFLLEIIYGIVFVLTYHFVIKNQLNLQMMAFWAIFYGALFVSLGVIAIYDLKHKYLPSQYLITFLSLTLIVLTFRYINDGSYLTLLSPLIVATPFLIVFLATLGRGIGFGDVIMFLGVGAFFGIAQGFAVLIIAIWIGAVCGIYTLLLRRIKKIKGTEIPFVPFIVISFLIVLFTDINIFSIVNIFS